MTAQIDDLHGWLNIMMGLGMLGAILLVAVLLLLAVLLIDAIAMGWAERKRR